MSDSREVQFPEEGTECDLCGRRYDAAATDDHWLGVELSRAVIAGGPVIEWLAFCSREHASEWFARPLPPAKPAEPTPPTTWGDRVVEALLFGVLGLLLLVFGLGVLTAVRFVISLAT